ncbi:hypothetical protein JHK85_040199 [Glycine max]|uniref:Uncharacterized protein n=1 Tax=Glycine soja TaxID=3848 RepID=A0A0B2PCD6_GLYSO|nr:hypothetical protein JHK85_040199 [Glycine max]KHN05277.1 hypothetical protein glysoja_039987 [Glycine soja]
MIGKFFLLFLSMNLFQYKNHNTEIRMRISASISIHTQHTPLPLLRTTPHTQNTTHAHVVDEWRQQKTYIHHSQDQLTFVLGTIRFKFFALRRATQGSGMYYTPFGVLIFGGEKVQETQWEKER